MSDDLTRALEPLRRDLAHSNLPEPSVVRRRGERRGITVAVAAALGGATVLGGAVGAAAYLAAPGTAPVPPASGPASVATDPPVPTTRPPAVPTTQAPTGTTGPSVPPAPGLAPEAAILPELRGAAGYQTALEYRTYLSPPRPCDRSGYPSDALARLARPAHGMVEHDQRPSVLMEYVARYADGSGGSAAYLAELRSDIRACPGRVAAGEDRDDHSWSIVESGFAGDESVLIRLRGSGKGYDPQACCTDFYLAVVRDGEIVVALTDLGWEGNGGDRAFAKESAVRALSVAQVLR
jgi:hypothetical protein